MTFHIITLFPKVFEPYLTSSIVGKARKRALVKVKYYNLIDFSSSRHRRVDDRPYGGGPGMVIQLAPLVKALNTVLKDKTKQKTKIILFSASGKQFDSKMAQRLAKKYSHIVLIAGRYEGVDERIKRVVASAYRMKIEEVSIGPYVLTGGELPAMNLIDAVTRQIKGVLGKEDSLEEKRLGVGVPMYTRPEIFIYRGKKYRLPQVLTTGDHAKILEWRLKHRKSKKTNR